MPLTPRLRTWHRRISLLIGLQLLAWTVSGMVFTWDPISQVRGDTSLSDELLPPAVNPTTLVSAADAARALGLTSVDRAELRAARGIWVWNLPDADQTPRLVDAKNGYPLPPLTADSAAAVARTRLNFQAQVASSSAVQVAEGEYRNKPLPAFRVEFDDPLEHHLYIHALTGDVTAVRHSDWRRFDWFWMLHVMDYTQRERFWTLWMKAAAALGVLSAASGLVLGVLVMTKRR